MYPALDEIKVDYIIINKSSVDFLYSKKTETSYQRFFNELGAAKEWNMIYSEKAVKNKTTGPEILVYSLICN